MDSIAPETDNYQIKWYVQGGSATDETNHKAKGKVKVYHHLRDRCQAHIDREVVLCSMLEVAGECHQSDTQDYYQPCHNRQ